MACSGKLLWVLLLLLAIMVGHNVNAKRSNNNRSGKTSVPTSADGGGSSGAVIGSNIPALFLFGDSIADTGNNNWLFTLARADYAPYGQNFVDRQPTGRFTDGLLAVDYLANFLGLPLVPPYLYVGDNILHGVCFASAGSGVLDTTGELYGQNIPLPKQIDNFNDVKQRLIKKIGEEEASNLISKSLHLVISGSNDFFSYYHASSISQTGSVLPPTFQANLLSQVTQQVKRLYDLGARKILVMSVPPVGCVPWMLYKTGGQCSTPLNEEIRSYNNALLSTILSTSNNVSFAGAHILYGNAFDLATKILTNPSSFGFTDGKKACCGWGEFGGSTPCVPLLNELCSNASTHVFWDYVHPTSAAYHLVARRLWEGTQDDIIPFNLQQLSLLT